MFPLFIFLLWKGQTTSETMECDCFLINVVEPSHFTLVQLTMKFNIIDIIKL